MTSVQMFSFPVHSPPTFVIVSLLLQFRMLPFPSSCIIHESLLLLPSHIHLPPRFCSMKFSRVQYRSVLPSGEYQGQIYDGLSTNYSETFSVLIAGSSPFPPFSTSSKTLFNL